MECITLSCDLDWRKSASPQISVKTLSVIYSGFMLYTRDYQNLRLIILLDSTQSYNPDAPCNMQQFAKFHHNPFIHYKIIEKHKRPLSPSWSCPMTSVTSTQKLFEPKMCLFLETDFLHVVYSKHVKNVSTHMSMV